MSDEIAAILTNAVSSCGLDMSPGLAGFAVVDVAVELDGAGDFDGAPAALTFKGRAGDEGGGMGVVNCRNQRRRRDRIVLRGARRSVWSTWHYHYRSDAPHLSCFLTLMTSLLAALVPTLFSSSRRGDNTATHACYTPNWSSPEDVSAGREPACLAHYREIATRRDMARLRQNHTTAPGLRGLAICGSSWPRAGL